MSEHCNILYAISVAHVYNSVQKLKMDKSGGIEGLFPDNILHIQYLL